MKNKSTAITSFKPAAWLGTLCATALVAAAIAMLSQSSHAQSQQPPAAPPPPPIQAGQLPPPPGFGNFAQHQQKELDHVAARMQILQTLQTCVQSATDRAGLKACNDMAKQSEQQLRH